MRNYRRNNTLQMRTADSSVETSDERDMGYIWPAMVNKRNELAGLGYRIGEYNIVKLAKERPGAAFVIAYVFLIEEMQKDVAGIYGTCGDQVDNHAPNSANRSSAFGWHVDDHAAVDTPSRGPYIAHSAVCQCSPGTASMTVAGLAESTYLGRGSFCIFPAPALHRTSTVKVEQQNASMWKIAGFFKPGQ